MQLHSSATLRFTFELVFLDEPTTGLDPKARHNVWAVSVNLKKRSKTVFLTTHYMEESQVRADRITIIDQGKIAAMGSPQELTSKYDGLKGLFIRNGDKTLTNLLEKKLIMLRLTVMEL